MSDLATCAQCGSRYDTARDAFCPRCGATQRAEVTPAAVAVAQRFDPGRRRVQASGALLLLVGALFLVSSLIGLAVPVGELSRQFADPMADQPGGTLVLQGEGPFDAVVATPDGEELANATAVRGNLTVESPDHATLQVRVRLADGAMRNATAIVLPGDTLRLRVEALDGGVHPSSSLRTTVEVGRVVFIAAALLLAGGGVAALLLRAWPLAVAAAVLGVVLGLLVLAAFLVAGLLFAVPFGFAAYFILRGRRFFRRAG